MDKAQGRDPLGGRANCPRASARIHPGKETAPLDIRTSCTLDMSLKDSITSTFIAV